MIKIRIQFNEGEVRNYNKFFFKDSKCAPETTVDNTKVSEEKSGLFHRLWILT